MGGRLGLRATACFGCLLVALSFVGLQAWDRDLTELLRSAPQVVGGLGFGLVLAPFSAAVLDRVGEDRRATAAAWLTLSRMTGMLVGAALLTSHGLGRFYARATTLDFGSPEFLELVQEAQVATFQEVFVAAGVLMAVAAAIALLIETGSAREAEQVPRRMAGLFDGSSGNSLQG
jgi:hypothetical protein